MGNGSLAGFINIFQLGSWRCFQLTAQEENDTKEKCTITVYHQFNYNILSLKTNPGPVPGQLLP